ncbi:MAG: 16S rRNA (cytosine(1402)-N(4))-methyltransferase, partial [Lachnospiraceae bacterium]
MSFHHISVLLNETVDSLNIRPDGIYVDGTLGGGGHAFQVASRLTAGGRLIGIDQDADAIAAATERLSPFADRVTIVRDNYVNVRAVLSQLHISGVDGIYLDLGVSSHQLDTAERGFSY